MDQFKRRFNKIEEPIVVDLSIEGSSLLVAFSGGRGRIGFSNFEFLKISRALNAIIIFVRDFQQMYYLRGVSEEYNTVEKTADHLRELIEKAQVDRVVFCGVSMGGYAAVLFGVLLNADLILALGPRTTVKWFHRLYYLDTKGSFEILVRIILFFKGDPRYMDLKDFLIWRSE
jgi:pimeloyl-ACP methyl ester carboxylesterase